MLAPLADLLQTTVDYLFGRTQDSGIFEFRGSHAQFDELVKMIGRSKTLGRGTMQTASASNDDDMVDLASVDLAYGFGGAFLDAGDPEVGKVRFSHAWLRAQGITAPPEVLGVAQGIGDSMEPLFYDRDVIVFDRSARLEDHMADKMWVFALGQIGMVKRLRPLTDGTVRIMSVNRTYPDEIAAAEEIYIIGRVVGSWRSY